MFLTGEQIDEESFTLLDKDTIKILIPPAGRRLKFAKLLAEYKSSLEELLLDITLPVSPAISDNIDLTRVSESNSFTLSDNSVAPSVHTSSDLIDFDLRQILQKTYPSILSLLIEKKQIGWRDKQWINRLFVSAFTDKYGPFPNTAKKASLAQLIVREFPSLKGHEGRGYVSYIKFLDF